MLVMVVFFIAFRWIHLSTPLIRLFLLVLILLLMPTLNFLPVWFALSLLRFRLPSRLPMMFILWMVAMMVVIIPSRTLSTNLASHFFDLVIGKILTSRLSLSKHLAHNLGNLLLLGKIGVFHNRRNASSRLLLLISKHLILCIYLVFRILA